MCPTMGGLAGEGRICRCIHSQHLSVSALLGVRVLNRIHKRKYFGVCRTFSYSYWREGGRHLILSAADMSMRNIEKGLCARCYKSAPRACSKCGERSYCSDFCQRKDWVIAPLVRCRQQHSLMHALSVQCSQKLSQ